MTSTTKKELILVCIALAVLVTAVYVLMRNKPTDTVVDTSPDIVTTPLVPNTTEIKSFSHTSSSTSAIVEYVQFTNQLPKSVVAQLNLRIETEAREVFNKNKKELEDTLKEFSRSNLSLDGRSFLEEVTIVPELIYVNYKTGIASVAQEGYFDTGGAHGSFMYDSSLYDLNTGKDLSMADILTGDYEKVLTPYIKNQIIRQTADCKNCEALGGELDPTMVTTVVSPHFVLNQGGITFLYGAYDLGPYALTSVGQEIYVPKEVLKDFIKREW